MRVRVRVHVRVRMRVRVRVRARACVRVLRVRVLQTTTLSLVKAGKLFLTREHFLKLISFLLPCTHFTPFKFVLFFSTSQTIHDRSNEFFALAILFYSCFKHSVWELNSTFCSLSRAQLQVRAYFLHLIINS